MPESRITLPTLREAKETLDQLVSASVRSVSVGDAGLFGPKSVSWRICRDPAFSVSALAGLLMAALHPVAMAAIDQHSDYRRDAWRRAQQTTHYVFTITFGSTPVALEAAARVRSIHSRISGQDPVTGRRYRADDPDLLLWVHCVNTWVALAGHRAFGAGFSHGDADRYVAEQVRAAVLVGLPESVVPATEEALVAWLRRQPLTPTVPGREFADLLMKARMPWTMRGFWALHLLGALAMLPDEVRAAYDFPRWLPRGPGARRIVRAVLRVIDLSYWAVPTVRDARRRLNAVARAAA